MLGDESGDDASVFDWQSEELPLEDELVAAVEAAARARQVSVAAWLQACWTILLWRLCGLPDEVIVGVNYDGRKYEELEGAFGPLARQVPVRVEFNAGSSMADVAEQVEEARDEAAKWQEYFSWEKSGHDAASATSGALTVENRSTAEALFCAAQYEYEAECMAGDEADAKHAPALHAGRPRLASLRSFTEPFKLKLRVTSRSDKPLARAELLFDASRLDHEAVRCLASQLRALASEAARDASRPV
ncbi:MAG: condensation domain-containing protein, partial [Acidobacteria bacterium]|nr:condensation domain-containing protein [Acidobacteriota bacterium]